MIRRILAFAVLLGVGFAILYFATGGETLARFGGGGTEIKRSDDEEDDDPSFVIPLEPDTAKVGERVGISYTGGMKVSPTREVPLPNGSILQVPLYELTAPRSRPLSNGKQELSEVRVAFFELHRTDEGPVPIEAAVLRADRAEVELGKDEAGRSSVAKDKDIELFGAVLETTEEARVKNLTLRIAQAIVRVTDEWMYITTADPTSEVQLDLAHVDGPVSLTGIGLDARFPVRDQKNGAVEVEVQRDPVLTHHGAAGESSLRASGPLRYVEDPATEVAEISVRGKVEIEGYGLGSGELAAGADDSVVAFGESLRGRLHRGSNTSGTSARLEWREMHLVGNDDRRAGLRGQGMRLECNRISMVPNRAGEPWLVTADGRPWLTQEVEGRALRFEAAERIHLIRLNAHLDPWLRGRGWTRRVPSTEPTQLLIFTGASQLTLPNDEGELLLTAADGLRVLRGDATDGPLSVLGLGQVELSSEDERGGLAVSGNDGFTLHAGPAGQRLRLGPEQPDSSHRFVVKSGELKVRGGGSCRLFRPLAADQPGEIEFASPDADLELTLTTGGSLHGADSLAASFDTEGLQSFDASGPTCRLEWQNEDERIDATAQRIRSTDPSTFELLGEPARAVSGRGNLEGRSIHVVRLSDEHTMLVAEGAARLRGSQLVESANGDMLLELDAEQITYLPFRAAAGAGSVPWNAELPHLDEATPCLLAREAVVVRQLDESGEELSAARGGLLVLQLGEDTSGLLRGTPARLVRRDRAGQDITAAAPELLLRGARSQRVTLLPGEEGDPSFTLANRRGGLRGFGSTGGSTEIVCRGRVEVDEGEVHFAGPVQVTSHTADRTVDSEGFQLDAESMRMTRHPETGEIVAVTADGGTDLRWRAIRAECEQLSLDLVTHMGIATSGPGELVRIWLPRFQGSCSRAEFNYLTYGWTAWDGVAEGERPGG